MKRHQIDNECNKVTITIFTIDIQNLTVSQAQTNTMSNTASLKKINNNVK